MFNIIRVLISFIIVILIVSITKRKITLRKINIGIILILIIYISLTLIPFENIFVRFEKAEDVAKYQYQKKINHILVEKESAIVIFEGERGHLFIRDEKGWKLDDMRMYNQQEIRKDREKEIWVTYYKNEKESNIFITIIQELPFNEIENNTIEDNVNSNFKKSIKQIENNKYELINYTVIDKKIENYSLYLNKQKINLE